MLEEADEAPEFPIVEETADVFEYLVEHWVPELRPPALVRGFDDLKSAVERRFAFKFHSTATRDEIEHSVREHWLLILRLSATENRELHCVANERLVVSHEMMDTFCDCVGNRNCDESGMRKSRWNIAQLATLSVTALIAFWLIIGIVYHAKKIHFYQEYRMSQRTLDEAHETLIKEQ